MSSESGLIESTGSGTTTKTHCPYCSLQCGVTLHAPGGPPDGSGAGSRTKLQLSPQKDFPTNLGGLCSKGWTAAELLDHPERLLSPMVRDARDQPLRPTSWDDALDRIVTAFLDAQASHGRDAVGMFGGGGLTNEKAYQFGKFARVTLRTAMIDYNGRFCMSSAANAAGRAFGIDRGLPFPLADLADADTVLFVGSNPADTLPPAMQFVDAGRARGARHVVIDPRRTSTAKGAHLHLQPVPGTDLALANGMLNVAIREGLVDEAYVQARTTGFDAVRRAVRGYWPDRVERISGVPGADLVRTVHLLAEARSAMILTARGAEQHSFGTDTAMAFINLALALGLPGRPASGYGTVTGQGNGQGGREHGQKADQLPGYRRLDDPAARAHVAGVWGVDPVDLPQPGLSAYEMLDRLGAERGVKALWVAASNVVVSAPRSAHVRDRLGALDFLVVSDIFCSETAALADVVLPTTQFVEESGTMTNLEGRVILRNAAIAPPPEVFSDLWVMRELAARLGGPPLSDAPREVFEELRRASAGGKADYAGISYERIAAEDGVFWPCPDETHPGTPRLFEHSFATPDGRARFHPVEHQALTESPDADYPYFLTTGRVLQQYQSGTQTRRVGALNDAAPEAVVSMHDSLARQLGVRTGDLVRLRSRRGAAVMRVSAGQDLHPDTVFAPFHFGGVGAANLLTNPALDPHSKMPEFKACAVAIERADDEVSQDVPTQLIQPAHTHQE